MDFIYFRLVSDDIAVACIRVFGGIGGVTSFDLCLNLNSVGRVSLVSGNLNISIGLNNPVILAGIGISKNIDVAAAISLLLSIGIPG